MLCPPNLTTMMLTVIMLGSLLVSTYASIISTISCGACSTCAEINRTQVCTKYAGEGAVLTCNEGDSLIVRCVATNACLQDPNAAIDELCVGCLSSGYSCLSEQSSDCFPATAKAQLQDGSAIRMEALQIGHRILVSDPNVYSDVHMFTHRDNKKMSTFYKFTFQDHEPITISPGHYMYVGDKMKTAESVMVDDLLKGSDGKSYRVIAKDKTVERGLYNPQTLHGDIVVDGIVVSTYTKAVHPKLAHAALAPLRMLYRLGWKNPFGNLFDQGNNKLTNMLPSGASEFQKTLISK